VGRQLSKLTLSLSLQAMTSPRRFPTPWQVEQIPGGYKVLDATGQALVSG